MLLVAVCSIIGFVGLMGLLAGDLTGDSDADFGYGITGVEDTIGGAIPPTEKKKQISRWALAGESLPWQAFLVPSMPKRARNESGREALAFSRFVGPMRCRQPAMATARRRCRAITGPEDMYAVSPAKKAFPRCSA